MNECRCGRETTAWVCEKCADAFTQALAEIPWLDGELDITQSRQRALPTEGSPPGVEKPLPWHEAAGDARRHLHGILVSWVRLCDEEAVPHQSPKRGLPSDDLPALSRWMMWRIDGLLARDIGADAVEEVVSAVAKCRRVIDRLPKREFVGPCHCGKELYRRPGAAEVTCQSCAATYDPDEMLRWMRGQVADRLVTVREGAGLLAKFGLEVKMNTVRQWVVRGKVAATGSNARGDQVYRLGDLIEAASKGVARSA